MAKVRPQVWETKEVAGGPSAMAKGPQYKWLTEKEMFLCRYALSYTGI